VSRRFKETFGRASGKLRRPCHNGEKGTEKKRGRRKLEIYDIPFSFLGGEPMAPESRMELGPFHFTVERAEFCYINRGLNPVTWDLNVYGHCDNDREPCPVFPNGMMLSAQGIPLTLSPCDDYTGFVLHTPFAAYRESGQSYFALFIEGEYETWDVELRIVEKKGALYLLEFKATTSFALDEGYESLGISAWAELAPPRESAKLDYAMWKKATTHTRG
jgi:hypothetical protein